MLKIWQLTESYTQTADKCLLTPELTQFEVSIGSRQLGLLGFSFSLLFWLSKSVLNFNFEACMSLLSGLQVEVLETVSKEFFCSLSAQLFLAYLE